MEQQGSPIEAKRFGRYLRRVREGRRLSLDAVEELSGGYTERVTKSHLSRIENGLAEPSFRKMFALSQIYGMPLTVLAERLELDLQQESLGIQPLLDSEELDRKTERLKFMGRHAEALSLLVPAIDRITSQDVPSVESTRWIDRWTIKAVSCLIKLERYELAKLEAERLLSRKLSVNDRMYAVQSFVFCCFQLGRYSVALMGIESAERDLDLPEVEPRMRADFTALRASIHDRTGEYDKAIKVFRSALTLYEGTSNGFEACKTRIHMAEAMINLGRLTAARAQLEASLLIAESAEYERLQAMALGSMAKMAFLQNDLVACETWAIRSNSIARRLDFNSLVFRNCYYLWKVAIGNKDAAGSRLNERTLRSLVARIDKHVPEVEEFRRVTGGGES